MGYQIPTLVNFSAILLVIFIAVHSFYPGILTHQHHKMTADSTTAWAQKYFDVWNSQDLDALGGLLDENASLRDWDVSGEGKAKVVELNGNIFKAVPKIKLEVLNILPSSIGSNPAAACEILVHVSETETLKVTDIIEFTPAGLIKAVRAYKG